MKPRSVALTTTTDEHGGGVETEGEAEEGADPDGEDGRIDGFHHLGGCEVCSSRCRCRFHGSLVNFLRSKPVKRDQHPDDGCADDCEGVAEASPRRGAWMASEVAAEGHEAGCHEEYAEKEHEVINYPDPARADCLDLLSVIGDVRRTWVQDVRDHKD
jgi:hypothetical protein